MMRGFGRFGWGMGWGHIWWIVIGAAVIAGIIVLAVSLSRHHSRNMNTCCGAGHDHGTGNQSGRFQAILRDKYNAGQINQAEYEERRLVLEGSAGDDPANGELAYLKEKYARCEIDTRGYIDRRNEILGGQKQG